MKHVQHDGGYAKRMAAALAAALMLLVWSAPLQAAKKDQETLSQEIIERIEASVYEVVVPKPEHDSLTYEKELPWDLLPYAVRNDKYYRIGTAFAIGQGRFVSAAHVMNLDVIESQFKELYLRDGEGEVYGIDKILKYSDHRDFVVFTLRKAPDAGHLELNSKPRRNERVWAVGNALGQGIVLRDGLFTSTTPEEVDGAWKWIRFSAAASPGNSGGPLLDSTGRVIGIVVRKSENENLNFALPISEVLDAPEGKAESFQKIKFTIENMDMTKHVEFKHSVDLPLGYDELNEELRSTFGAFAKDLLQEFLKENDAQIFPNGSGTAELMHSIYSAVFPHLIARTSDGEWSAYRPEEVETTMLGDNGWMDHGTLADTLYVHMRKPDTVSLKTFMKDSKLFMDLVLRGLNFEREVGSEEVKVTSLGKAREESRFTDRWGRRWTVRSWLIEYSDEMVVAMTLPVPGGCISLIKAGQTGRVLNGSIPDLQVLADFVYLSYYGTFTQWKEFLALKKLMPDPLRKMDISFGRDHTLTFHSDRLAFTHAPGIMKLSEDSDLKLMFGFFKDGDKAVWDVRALVVGEDKNNLTSFGLYRQNHPDEELPDSYASDWRDLVERRFPYNGDPYYDEGSTIAKAPHWQVPAADKGGRAAPFVYSITYQAEGSIEKDVAAANLKKINQSVKVLEAQPEGQKLSRR